jgi:folate-binding protein YgfZ
MQTELLTQLGVIEACGEDTLTFLQSQLTQDVLTLSKSEARIAGYCTAKGRMLGQFTILWHGDKLLLLTHVDMVDALVKRLSMFVLRSKCKLRNASADYTLAGMRGPVEAAPAMIGMAVDARTPEFKVFATPGVSSSPALAVRWPSAQAALRLLLCGRPAAGQCAPPAQGEAFWQTENVLCGIPFLEPANLEAFVPQMVNLDLIGGVSFSKGCYPGQEIVARSHYLGKMKRRMQLGQTAALLSPGQDVYSSAHPGEPAGRVVNAAPLGPDAHVVLFEISSDDLQGASLHAGAPDGATIQLRSLPYNIPAPKA